MKIDYMQCPPNYRHSLERYVRYGADPGHFLMDVLVGDLFGMMGRADRSAMQYLFDLCSFIYNDLPGGCWGSRMKVGLWCENGGQAGPVTHVEPPVALPPI